MSKFTATAKSAPARKYEDLQVASFEGGTVYNVDPLSRLRLVTTGAIFGEPQFYVPKGMPDKNRKAVLMIGNSSGHSVLLGARHSSVSAAEIMEQAIDDALAYDFEGAMSFAGTLRNKYYMRLNPAVLCVRAAVHNSRPKWSKTHPGRFNEIIKNVARRPDDLTTMIEYYIHKVGSKKEMPSILKRAVAARIPQFDRFQLNKHAQKGIGLVDVIRITHAKGELIDELMKNGNVKAEEGKETWRELRSAGKSWAHIIDNTFMSHEDMLYNLRGIFEDIKDINTARRIAANLVESSKKAKVFPYKYWVAYKAIEAASTMNHRGILMDALNDCITQSLENVPKIPGKVLIMTDNSGSTDSAIMHDGMRTTIRQIDNLSSVITALTCDEGIVVSFGTDWKEVPISRRNSVISQAESLGRVPVGGSTEPEKYLRHMIDRKVVYDTMFIYSDMQVMTSIRSLFDLLNEYRRKVNPKLNVFSVNTAGTTNSVFPEHIYRGALLSGWTGKEAEFAQAVIEEWDNIENRKKAHADRDNR